MKRDKLIEEIIIEIASLANSLPGVIPVRQQKPDTIYPTIHRIITTDHILTRFHSITDQGYDHLSVFVAELKIEDSASGAFTVTACADFNFTSNVNCEETSDRQWTDERGEPFAEAAIKQKVLNVVRQYLRKR